MRCSSMRTNREAVPIPKAELWPNDVDVRDVNGYLWKTVPVAQALLLVERGVADPIGRASVRYIRLHCEVSSGRRDANRTTRRLRIDTPVLKHVIEHLGSGRNHPWSPEGQKLVSQNLYQSESSKQFKSARRQPD